MNILFIHQNMPGQFLHLARALAANPTNRVVFLTRPRPVNIAGVRKVEYNIGRSKRTHPFLQNLQNGIAYGESVANALLTLHKYNFVPDIIYAHPGWGETLYVKDVFPCVPLIHYCEFFYHGLGADTFFQPSEPAPIAELMRIRTRNAINMLSLEACDLGVTPTQWQWRLHPEAYRHKIRVIHDGIDTNELRPHDDACFILPNGVALRRTDEVITYANRSLEPFRGLYTFADAVEIVAKGRPNCQFVIAGAEDGRYYGAHPPKDKTFKELAVARIREAKDRVHFVGRLPRSQYISLLQISSAHIYLSSPFVLSWSMLEAMAAGCLIVASTTPPVAEVVSDGQNGLLADFFSPEEVAERVLEALSEPKRMEQIRHAARNTILERYALERCLPKQLALFAHMSSVDRSGADFRSPAYSEARNLSAHRPITSDSPVSTTPRIDS
jgi:glycosyltransferase involved in cell wall biosynthesis